MSRKTGHATYGANRPSPGAPFTAPATVWYSFQRASGTLEAEGRWSGIAREYRINGRIRATTVRVIGDDGSQLGVMSLQEAMTMARERETDLVEVAPGADPPVCRLLDYGKFRYVQTKKEREARKTQKVIELREVRLRPGIGQHDLDAKSRTIHKLLAAGAKVRVAVVFRGRSITHPELGVELLKKVAEGLESDAKLEKAPSMEGRALSITLVPAIRKDATPRTAEASQDDGSAKVDEGPENAKDKDP